MESRISAKNSEYSNKKSSLCLDYFVDWTFSYVSSSIQGMEKIPDCLYFVYTHIICTKSLFKIFNWLSHLKLVQTAIHCFFTSRYYSQIKSRRLNTQAITKMNWIYLNAIYIIICFVFAILNRILNFYKRLIGNQVMLKQFFFSGIGLNINNSLNLFIFDIVKKENLFFLRPFIFLIT